MSVPKKQHYIPQCYLREWVDPKTPADQNPYVWIFEKGKRSGRKKAPSNIFTEQDLYTLNLETGEKSYSIEETLSNLEGKYAEVFRNKIKKHLALNEEDHIILCAFVSVMLQRTLRNRDNLDRFYNELVERSEEVEKANNLEPTESKRLKEFQKNTHKLGVIKLLPDITKLLIKMSVAFLCAKGKTKFLTSDDPCNLFNPDLQWQKFYGPGLGQKNIQVTLPLSPDIMLCLSWSNLLGYIKWDKSWMEEANRMIVNHCYHYFISHDAKTKRRWFLSYPLDGFFILKIIKHKINLFFYKIKNSNIYYNVRKR